MSSRRRKVFSTIWDGKVDQDSDDSPERGRSDYARGLKGLVNKFAGTEPDPTNPVINGASSDEQPWLRGVLADLATQLPRSKADFDVLKSVASAEIFHGGLVDDKTYQMEKFIQLAASLPDDSHAQSKLASGMIKTLWNNLQHPPISLQGHEYKYRTADGSNNNLMRPSLGKAGSSYARTVTPRTLQPGVLPDPGVIFDALFARTEEPREHPNKISSMLFYLASIIIHDVFHTDVRDPSRVKTSSYLDLAPLYGSSTEEQARVRSFRDGFLKPDTFSESRILGFPPGVSALLVCFNRYHNYVAIQLKTINENGRFDPPVDLQDEAALRRLDEDLFQTARLITCGLYVNIILYDYVRTILNLNRSDSTWTLDPRDNTDIFDSTGVPQGVGNQVSVEFNLVYRWHSATSVKDEKWTKEAYEKIFPGQDTEKITEQDFVRGLYGWLKELPSDPSQWPLDLGRCPRNKRGVFEDEDLVNILTEATEDVACAFGARQVPIAMKLIEVMGIKQARSWNVATLNEFRKFFSLEPHKSFADISTDPDVQHALRALYKHPDYVELYPGLVAEDAKESVTPGSGICLGFTNSRTILSDAVALVRGDRFYTVDYSPANLTNWGINQVKSDPTVAQGHCIYNLFMRALAGYYRGNSVYAMFPFVVPDENRRILRNLGIQQDYDFSRPKALPPPISIRSWTGVTEVLSDSDRFKVPWGPHITYLTGHEFMLGNDTHQSTVDHAHVDDALYCPAGHGMDQIRRFYETLTRQLIVIGQENLGRDWFQLDLLTDVAAPAHSVFISKLWHIPLKAEGDTLPTGVEVDKLWLAMSVMFAYVFLDADTARSFRLRKAAKDATDQLSELCTAVYSAINAGSKINFSKLYHLIDEGEEGQMLTSYGQMLVKRMFKNGWSVEKVVANMLPTAVAAAATQAQHMTQMIDVYLDEQYQHHWPEIQKLAQSEDPQAFELLKSYALEANRLAPSGYGVLRTVAQATTIKDQGVTHNLQPGDSLYMDFIAAGRDELMFPDPLEIKTTRSRESYIHHGWGMHKCIGREIVEVSMAAQLKVFAQLKNLRRAPGPQGQLKFTWYQPNPVSSHPVPSPGQIKLFMQEDWSDSWPFPTTLKVHHDGFLPYTEPMIEASLLLKTSLPNAREEMITRSRENSRSRSRSRQRSRQRSSSRSQSAARLDSLREVGEEPDVEDRAQVNGTNGWERDLAFGDNEADDNNELSLSGILSDDTAPRITVNGNGIDHQPTDQTNGERLTNGHSH